jgi:DNA-binding IclR family transcriptional regulator
MSEATSPGPGLAVGRGAAGEPDARPAGRRSPLLRGLYVLEALDERPATVGEIAEALAISRSSAHRLMAKLEEGGYVKREPGARRFMLATGRFPHRQDDPGALEDQRVPDLGEEIHRIVGQWGEAIHGIVVELRDATGESAVFSVAARDRMVYVAFCPSVHPVRVEEYIGSTRPMHCSAVGKAYLSGLEDETLDIVLGRLSYTEGTPSAARGPFQLRDKLLEVSKLGYAVDHDECLLGLSCVATPVFVNQTVLVGAAGVTGPTQRFSDERTERYGNLLLEKAHYLKEG